MTFPLEKILSVSLKDFVETQDTALRTYEFVGVNSTHIVQANPKAIPTGEACETNEVFAKDLFAENVPKDALVVVEYSVNAVSGFAGDIGSVESSISRDNNLC